jgi:hypothetical protein
MTSPEHSRDHGKTRQPGHIWLRIAAFHDVIFSNGKKTALKRLVVRLGLAGFAIHLLLIFLSNTLAHPPALLFDAGKNYLQAISTPFNFILFFEVVTLIGVLHESTTKAVKYQFEIVSLVFIREVFKDLPDASAMVEQHRLTWGALPLFVDMWAGFLMYLLVAVFEHVSKRGVRHPDAIDRSTADALFVAHKKSLAVGLVALLLIIAARNVGLLAIDALRTAVTGQEVVRHITHFYNDLFTVMIITDVLILILSIVVAGQYEVVFRNAAFVVSIVLIRFSLEEGYPFGPPLALLAMLFGILTLMVFNYHMRNNESANG